MTLIDVILPFDTTGTKTAPRPASEETERSGEAFKLYPPLLIITSIIVPLEITGVSWTSEPVWRYMSGFLVKFKTSDEP